MMDVSHLWHILLNDEAYFGGLHMTYPPCIMDLLHYMVFLLHFSLL
jgi:hypothetical protein